VVQIGNELPVLFDILWGVELLALTTAMKHRIIKVKNNKIF
jgi:hypothetical protein